jgi:Xaa-Pro aminopeptidase
MIHKRNQIRLEKCSRMMEAAGLDVLLLTKPANMFYLTGDGRLCAFAMITQEGKVALGVPSTDVEDVSRLAHFDHIAGFEDEVGMIHSIAHFFEHFGIHEGNAGLEFTFLTQSMMGMLTHPHAKPAGVIAKDCTHILSELRMVKEQGSHCIRETAKVVGGDGSGGGSCKAGHHESRVAAEAEYACVVRRRRASAAGSGALHRSGLPTSSLQHGDLVMMDITIVSGYSADICRTVCVGSPPMNSGL